VRRTALIHVTSCWPVHRWRCRRRCDVGGLAWRKSWLLSPHRIGAIPAISPILRSPPGRRVLDSSCCRALLAVEVLSVPGARFTIAKPRLPVKASFPACKEILLVDSASVLAEVPKREGDRRVTEVVQGPEAIFLLASMGLPCRCPGSMRGSRFRTRRRRSGG
jgi:hypothetical protein